jgi:hypothetical protein
LEQWPLNGICTGAHTTDAAINTQTAMVERWCAFESGLTAEKMRHALLMLPSTIGMPDVVAASTWADDVPAKRSQPVT